MSGGVFKGSRYQKSAAANIVAEGDIVVSYKSPLLDGLAWLRLGRKSRLFCRLPLSLESVEEGLMVEDV